MSFLPRQCFKTFQISNVTWTWVLKKCSKNTAILLLLQNIYTPVVLKVASYLCYPEAYLLEFIFDWSPNTCTYFPERQGTRSGTQGCFPDSACWMSGAVLAVSYGDSAISMTLLNVKAAKDLLRSCCRSFTSFGLDFYRGRGSNDFDIRPRGGHDVTRDQVLL